MTLKIGLLVGREASFPPAFLDEVRKRGNGVAAEYVKLGGTRTDEPCPYAVLVDRVSHEVPYYRSYLKHAALQGAAVVNNPFVWSADDKFFDGALAARLGVAQPRTVALPNKDYGPGVVHGESLRNLVYPLDWQGVVDYVGLPCVLKDAHGGGWKSVALCVTLDELLRHYNRSGLRTMVVQEYVKWEKYVRCLCVGQEEVLPMPYDPSQRRYIVDPGYLDSRLRDRLVGDSLRLVKALGYDMNAVEWAVRDGVPHAIDVLNPAPDLDVHSLTPTYFRWAVEHLADLAVRLAKQPRAQRQEPHWSQLF